MVFLCLHHQRCRLVDFTIGTATTKFTSIKKGTEWTSPKKLDTYWGFFYGKKEKK
jgi:hypothetical protein